MAEDQDLWSDYYKGFDAEQSLLTARQDDADRELRRRKLNLDLIRSQARVSPESIETILDTEAPTDRLKRAYADIIKNDPTNLQSYVQNRATRIDKRAIAEIQAENRTEQLKIAAELRAAQQRDHDARMEDLARDRWQHESTMQDDRQGAAADMETTRQGNRLVLKRTPGGKTPSGADVRADEKEWFTKSGFSSIAALEDYAAGRLVDVMAQGRRKDNKVPPEIEDLSRVVAAKVRENVQQGMTIDAAIGDIVQRENLSGIHGGKARDALKRLQSAPSTTAVPPAQTGSASPATNAAQDLEVDLDALAKKHTKGEELDAGALVADFKQQLRASGQRYTKEIAAELEAYLRSIGEE